MEKDCFEIFKNILLLQIKCHESVILKKYNIVIKYNIVNT